MFNWIVRDRQQYLEPFNFIDFWCIELLDHLTVYLKMYLQTIYLIYI